MDLRKSWDRLSEKYDRELTKHIRAAENGVEKDLSKYEQDWIKKDKDMDPAGPEAEENYEGAVKAINEMAKSLSERSGHRFSEPEIALRYVEHLKKRVRSRTQNRDARWEEKLWAPSLEKAIFYSEIIEIWSEVGLKLIDHYNLDRKGFENNPSSLALVMDKKKLAKKYVKAGGQQKQKVRKEIEGEALKFVEKLESYLQEELEESRAIIEEGEQELPDAARDMEELRERSKKLYSLIKNRDRDEEDGALGIGI